MRARLLLVLAGCGRLGFGTGGDPSDGGATDGTGGDAPGDVGDVPACPAGVQICETFEEGISAVWNVDTMATLDTTRAHRGAGSMRIHTAAFAANDESYQSIFQGETIVANPSTFYVRTWFWLSALPAPGNGLELITAERPGQAGDYVFLFDDSTHIYTQFGNDSKITSTVPVGAWFCLVWKVVRSTTATGSLELTGDLGTVLLPNVVTDSAASPMTLLTIGAGFSASNTPSAQPAFDIWIDDVIVDDGPISCTD